SHPQEPDPGAFARADSPTRQNLPFCVMASHRQPTVEAIHNGGTAHHVRGQGRSRRGRPTSHLEDPDRRFCAAYGWSVAFFGGARSPVMSLGAEGSLARIASSQEVRGLRVAGAVRFVLARLGQVTVACRLDWWRWRAGGGWRGVWLAAAGRWRARRRQAAAGPRRNPVVNARVPSPL